MPDRSRPGDGWSETEWSQPSYGRDRGERTAADDGWGHPSYSGDVDRPASPAERSPASTATRERGQDTGWSKAGPLPGRQQRAARAAERGAARTVAPVPTVGRPNDREAQRTQRSVDKLAARTSSGRASSGRTSSGRTLSGGADVNGGERRAPARPQGQAEPFERGLTWWLALAVLVVITALGALLDSVADISGQDGFNYGIVVASIVAILVVKRSQMFPIVIAPPIVYSLGALVQLYLKSSRTSGSRNGVLIDAVQNYLVYGFPALAAATAASLIIAGIRLIARK